MRTRNAVHRRPRAVSKARQRGLTSVEAALVIALGGTLLAVAVPTFVRELHASRFAEPVDGLSRLSAAAIAYAHDRPPAEAFPPTAPLTPSSPPRATREVDPVGAWDHPTWQALHFRATPEGVPHAFAFGFDTTRQPGRSAFVAHAHGDLNGNGVVSTFEVRGHFSVDEGTPILEPGMYVDKEVE